MGEHAPGTSAQSADQQTAQAEELLRHFEQLETQFDQVREGLSLSHRLTTIGMIAAMAAHEFKNILTPMISYGQLAMARPDDPQLMKKAVEKLLAGAEQAALISSSMLGFASDEDQEQAAPLAETIDQTLDCLGRHPSKDGIELTIDVPDAVLAITPLNLQQVLLNLILNARKAMPGGGQLVIRATVDGGSVQIDVSDSGPGIPDEIRDRLFEPFVTRPIRTRGPVDPARTEPKGTGLGLCICRDLLHRVGGSISVHSEPGQGATFHLTIPAVKSEVENP